MKDGDRNTRYFHTCAKIKVAKANIACLVDGSNTLTDPHEIKAVILAYYQTLYSSSVVNSGISHLFDFVHKLATEDDNAMLSSVPSWLEIRQAVFGLDAPSAAGPDGFSWAFYHCCWLIIELDVCLAIQEFVRLGAVHKYLNANLIVLLPKVKGANSISQVSI